MSNSSDEAAFEVFVRVHGPSLLRTAWLLTGDRGHAEDLLQQVLERTARKWSRLKGDPLSYARRALVNGATDRHRRRRARVAEVLPERMPEGSAAPGGLDDTDRIVLRSALVSALAALPARQRSVVVCRYVLDLDERATADALGVSIGTVKASASRGLASLRALAPQLDLIPATKETRP